MQDPAFSARDSKLRKQDLHPEELTAQREGEKAVSECGPVTGCESQRAVEPREETDRLAEGQGAGKASKTRRLWKES